MQKKRFCFAISFQTHFLSENDFTNSGLVGPLMDEILSRYYTLLCPISDDVYKHPGKNMNLPVVLICPIFESRPNREYLNVYDPGWQGIVI